MIYKTIIGRSIWSFLVAFSGSANAIVITDTNFTLGDSGIYGRGDYSLSVLTGISTTSMWFDKTDKIGTYNYLDNIYNGYYSTLSFVDTTVDVNSGYFLVPHGAEFTAATIADGKYQPLLKSEPPTNYYINTPIDVPYGDFYLGVALDNNLDWEYTEFGWIQLSNSSTGLEMISSAMAYDEAGIIIGTTQAVSAVPVPAAAWLFGSGLIGLISIARRKNSS